MPSAMDTVRSWYGANGAPIEQRNYPEAASQTFKRGDLVYLNSGKVTAAASVGASVSSGTKVLGIALMDATGTTDTSIPVAVGNGQLRWVLPVSTLAASRNTAVTDVGSTVDLYRVAAGKWAADFTSGQTKAVVTSIHPQYAVGEGFGWVEIQFLDAQVDVRV